VLFQVQATSRTKPSALSIPEKTCYVLIPTKAHFFPEFFGGFLSTTVHCIGDGSSNPYPAGIVFCQCSGEVHPDPAVLLWWDKGERAPQGAELSEQSISGLSHGSLAKNGQCPKGRLRAHGSPSLPNKGEWLGASFQEANSWEWNG
jgi:hypothetical protein